MGSLWLARAFADPFGSAVSLFGDTIDQHGREQLLQAALASVSAGSKGTI